MRSINPWYVRIGEAIARSFGRGRTPVGTSKKDPRTMEEPPGVSRIRAKRRLGPREVLGMFAVVIVLTVFLGAGSILDGAEDISSRPLRDVAVFVAKPVFRVSHFLYLDRPLQWANNRSQSDARVDGEREDTPATKVATSSSMPGPRQTTSPTTHATSTTRPQVVFNAQRPLRVLMVGDSLLPYIANGMVKISQPLPDLDVKYVSKTSTGLIYTKKFDWFTTVKTLVAQYRPDVTVAIFGANDRLPIQSGGEVFRLLSPEWQAEYGRKVGDIMDIANQAGARVVWIGLPIMRASDFNGTCRSLNAITSRACAAHPNAVFLDTWGLFSDRNGNYSAYLADSSGRQKLMRAPDGIHFTPTGGDRVANALTSLLRTYYTF